MPGVNRVVENDVEADNFSDDLNRQWYINFGFPLMTALLYSWLTPIATVVQHKVLKYYKKNTEGNIRIHKEAVDFYKKPEFSLTRKYAESLMNLYLCWIFNCGMPLFYLIGFGIFTIKFYCDKFILLRCSRKTSKMDSSLNNRLYISLGIMLWIHCAISLAMLTVPNIFDPKDISTNDGMESFKSGTDDSVLSLSRYSNVQVQFVNWHKWTLYIISIYLVVDYALHKYYFRTKDKRNLALKYNKFFIA